MTAYIVLPHDFQAAEEAQRKRSGLYVTDVMVCSDRRLTAN